MSQIDDCLKILELIENTYENVENAQKDAADYFFD